MMDTVVTKYNRLMEDADPRVADLPFMSDAWWNTCSVLIYLLIVNYLGPKYLKGKEPLNFRFFLFIYNMILVVFNAYLFYEYLAAGWWGNYSLECQEVDYSTSPNAIRMLNVTYLYWLS